VSALHANADIIIIRRDIRCVTTSDIGLGPGSKAWLAVPADRFSAPCLKSAGSF
jgi:hypothetical protein